MPRARQPGHPTPATLDALPTAWVTGLFAWAMGPIAGVIGLGLAAAAEPGSTGSQAIGPGLPSAQAASAVPAVSAVSAVPAVSALSSVPAVSAVSARPPTPAGAAAAAAPPAPMPPTALPGRSLWSLPGLFTDEHGQTVPLQRLAGEATVVAMEYTACRFVCSTAWRQLSDLQAEADRRGQRLRFVLISIDPAHDTPALWRQYRQARGLQQRGNWHFLTGDRASTDAVAALLGVRWWLYDGQVMHDFRILRLDARGQVHKAMLAYDLTAAQFLAN